MASAVEGNSDINRFGLSEVYPRSSIPANVDIVFVHGLNGDPHRTWASERTKVFWPAQLLPPLLEEEKARVLVYGYDSEVTSFTDGVSKDKIHNHAELLVAALAANRRLRRATERPIIFVAHSLGGLVVKRALIYSSDIRGPKTEHLRSIFVSTFGILFLGTPHKGSDVALWGTRLEWICNAVMPKKIVDSQPQLIEALKTNNETLQNIDRQFIQLMSKYHIYFFHEAKPTDVKGTFRYIVEEDSASPNVQDVERAGIQADHSHMCKFDSDSSPGFDLVAEGIQRYAEEAPATIKTRWIQERKASDAQKQAAVEEIIPGIGSLSGPAKDTPDSSSSGFPTPGNSQEHLPLSASTTILRNTQPATSAPDALEPSSKLAEPYFIVPPGFRPNTFFVGMENELKELDRRVFDRRRRADGTACVLVHGQPGAGKSHLARQYVNKNRKKFDGGIFWINAKLKEELYQSYWNIAQKVVLRDSPHLRLTPDGSQRPFEDVVKTWFEARQDWLIVFDGITVDKEEDAIELQSFIPDSQNSSIIYVSRASNLGSKQRLLRPFLIKVHPLNEVDARRLLFKELNIKKPTEAEEKSAKELVRKMGGLPLAIHAISHRLANTHEPLSKYDMKSYSADPKLGGTYKAIMDDLEHLGHQGAWNTISVICFYGPHLPVEMIRLGIRALRHSGIGLNSSWDGEKPDLDITFAILMRNALIERNEPDEGSSMSSSRDSLIDPEPIDMLKMHSVVQNFCCDYLNSAHALPRWLGYAVDVFCESYRQADVRIKAKPQTGRVSDYREYLVHGKRLLDHSRNYESKKQNLEAVRSKLSPILATINAEIRAREPGSSQESVCGQVFQMSIFDKSSSASYSVASEHEARTPTHRPPPLMPHESWYGGDLAKAQVETPTSIPSNSPRIVDHSPRAQLPHYLHEEMDDMDRDEPPRSHSMYHTASDSTARPHGPAPETQNEGWQTAPPSKRVTSAREFQPSSNASHYGRPRPHRDLGSFRPTPSRAEMTRITNVDATGSFSQPRGERRGNLSGASDAVTSLTAVHHSSPPRSRGSRSISQPRSLSRPRTPGSSQPTYAMVAARGHLQQPVSSQRGGYGSDGTGAPGPYQFVPTSSALPRGRSPERLSSRSGNIQPSPLAAEFHPRAAVSQAAWHEPNPYAPVCQGSVHHTPDHSPTPPYTNTQPPPNFTPPKPPYPSPSNQNRAYHLFPPLTGPNPAALPLEENISITAKRRLPSDFYSLSPPNPSLSLSLHHPSPFPDPHHPSPFPDRHPLPAGYASHPMTRAASSHQSYHSAAATDPVHHASPLSPRFSPLLPGADVSPRDRAVDGRPLSKSPKLYHAVPVPHSPGYAVAGAGGWAGGYEAPTTGQMHYEGASMGRAGSGPGVAIGGGTEIAEFGGEVGGGYGGKVVQFGELAPVVIEEGRGRVREWERRRRGGGRGSAGSGEREWGGVPYPVGETMGLVMPGGEGGEEVGLGLEMGF